MRYHMIVVHDLVAEVYSPPQFVLNKGAAVRGFGDEIRRPHTDERPNNFNQHPQDFELVCIGVYEDEDASITTIEGEVIARGRDYV